MIRIAPLASHAACAALALAFSLPAQAAGEAKAAVKAKAKATATSKVKSKAAAPAAAAAAAVALSPGQLAAAQRVHTGRADCEFNQQVDVQPVAGREGNFTLGFKKAKYNMVPEETTTGAVRLEDKKAGVVWLQIANKSMLMNSKIGQRMVDDCVHAAQK